MSLTREHSTHDFVNKGTEIKDWHSRPVPHAAIAPNRFVNKHSLLIYWQSWAPPGASAHDGAGARAIVLLSHGFGEHIGRYEHVAAALCAAGFYVFALDHQGYGRSEGDRAHVQKFSDYVDDVLQFLALAKARAPAADAAGGAFLLGHSMGGGIAVQTARAAPTAFRGVVLSGVPPPPLPALLAPAGGRPRGGDFTAMLPTEFRYQMPLASVAALRCPRGSAQH